MVRTVSPGQIDGVTGKGKQVAVRTGQVGQDIWDRTSGTGQLDKTAETGWSGKVGLTGHPEQDREDSITRTELGHNSTTMFRKHIFGRPTFCVKQFRDI